MENKVGEKIVQIRKRKGLSQDELAGMANVNIRTIQRIENGETEPRGHTLSSICKALDVNIEDILDYGKTEDKTLFVFFHLSVIAGLIIPFGDIIVPLILWLTKRDKIVGLNKQAKNLLIFRGLFDLLLFAFVVASLVVSMNNFGGYHELSKSFLSVAEIAICIYGLATLLYPVIVAISVSRSQKLKSYYPPFVK